MRKALSVLLVLLMLVMCFAACDDATEPTVNIGAASDADNDADRLKTVLDDIAASVQPGTMGVSFNAAAKAVELLKWCAATDMNTTQVGDAVAAYLSALPMETKALYPHQLLLVTDAAANMQDAEYRTYMLLDIGYDPEGFAWDEETFVKAAAIAEKTQGFVVPTA